jgi:glycosyltransferase involved in cell wall biosynthesis
MKYGLLTQWYAPEPGGALVPTVLARELARRDHDVRVLTGFPNYPTGVLYPGYRQSWKHRETLDGVDVRRAPLFTSHDGRAARRAANYLSFAASAAVHAKAHLGDVDALWVYNSPAPVAVVASQLRRRAKVPYLLHIMDVWPDSVLESGMVPGRVQRVAEPPLVRMVQRGYRDAAAIAVISPGQIDLLRDRGVPAEKLSLVPLCADEDLFFPRPRLRSDLPEECQDASLVLMYAGAMGHVQNLETAIRAVAAVRDEGVHLVMVGGGVAEDSLRQLARELNATNIHFLGRKPIEAMGSLSAAADVHLVSLADSPLMRVTMPSKTAAIMASERAIIAACAGDAATVVSESGAGVAVFPGDVEAMAAAMSELGQAPQDVSAMGANGRKYYEQEWARSVVVERVEDALGRIARGAR